MHIIVSSVIFPRPFEKFSPCDLMCVSGDDDFALVNHANPQPACALSL